MFLSQEQISRCTHWLLAHASPPVLYLTHRHILHSDPQAPELQDLWQKAAASQAAAEIFSRQNPDGSFFSGGPWGPRGYRQESGRGYTATRPKFVTTAWLLPYLGEMGFTAANDARVRAAAEFILQDQGFDQPRTAPLPDPLPQEANCCGLYATPLRALASVGMADDERLQTSFAWLNLCQRDDGGWLNPNHLAGSPTPSTTQGRWPWDRSCVWGSYYAVQTLYYAGRPNLAAGCGFLLWHLAQARPEAIQTWVYHGHNTVKELLMFSEAGLDPTAGPIQTLLDWLSSLYRPEEGMFRAQERPIPNFVRQTGAIVQDYIDRFGPDYWDRVSKTGPAVLRYHLYHLVEDDWLTYTLTRIACQFHRPTPGPAQSWAGRGQGDGDI